jgi:probable HAF family extracellular repeat protein
MKANWKRRLAQVAVGALGGLVLGASADEVGFLDVNGTFSRIEIPGAFDTSARGITNAGEVVGSFRDSNFPYGHGFLKVGGTFTTLDAPAVHAPTSAAPETSAHGINNSGQVVGTYSDSEFPYYHGFLYAGGTFSIIEAHVRPPFGGAAPRTSANGINDAGHIVGSVSFSDRFSQNTVVKGFLDVAGTFSEIKVPDAFQVSASGINNAGQIVGTWEDSGGRDHGFLDVAGTFSTIDVPGALSTQAFGINNAGQIVGEYFDGRTVHGFLYAGGTFSTIDVPGALSTEAFGINDAGHIVGFSDLPPSPPVPESGSLVLFSVGLLGLGLAWRRRVSALPLGSLPRIVFSFSRE